MLVQAAVETTKSMPGIWISSAAIGSITTLSAIWIREYFTTRRAKKNGTSVLPGKGEVCQKHGEKLVKLETKQEGTDDDIKEMKTNILTLVGDVKILLGRTLPRV